MKNILYYPTGAPKK